MEEDFQASQKKVVDEVLHNQIYFWKSVPFSLQKYNFLIIILLVYFLKLMYFIIFMVTLKLC